MPGFKVLNVAEKNDAAKNIANIMSGGRANRREGYSHFNKIYEFDYMVQGQQAEMVMTSLSVTCSTWSLRRSTGSGTPAIPSPFLMRR